MSDQQRLKSLRYRDTVLSGGSHLGRQWLPEGNEYKTTEHNSDGFVMFGEKKGTFHILCKQFLNNQHLYKKATCLCCVVLFFNRTLL